MSLSDDGALLSDCRSGWLTVEEDFSARLTHQEHLKYALQCMGRNPSDKAVQRYWQQCGGSMSFDQFCVVMKRERHGTMQDLMKAFRKIDSNGDGFITAQELQKILTKQGEKMSLAEVQSIIHEADSNRDGKLDYSEFCHMLLSTSEECSKATQLRADIVLDNKSSQTGQTGRKGSHSGRSHPQMTDARGRREKRREEIRSQLYSGGSSGPVVGEGSRAESSMPTRRHPRTSNRELNGEVPSGAGVLVGLSEPILLQKQIGLEVSSTASQDGGGVVSTAAQSLELHSKETETAVLVTEVAEDGKSSDSGDTRKERDTQVAFVASSTPQPHVTEEEGGEPPEQATLDSDVATTPTGATSLEDEPRRDEPQLAVGTTRKPTGLAAKKVLSDPFDLSSKERPSKLPPLRVALPPVLPPVPANQGPTETSELKEGQDSDTGKPPMEASEGSKEENNRAPEPQADGTQKEPGEIPVQDVGEEQSVKVAMATPSEASSTEHPSRDANTSEPPGNERSNARLSGPGPVQQEPLAHSKVETVAEIHPSKPLKEHETRKQSPTSEEVPLEEQPSQETESRRQPSHSAPGTQEQPPSAAARKEAAPSSVVPAPPKRPANLEAWNSITGKGCFYLDVEEGEEEGVAKCHHYRLNLPSPTNVWVEVGVTTAGNSATDVLLFIFHTDENEDPTHLIAYTQHVVNRRWVCRLDLDAGNYALVPFSSGCHLKLREGVEGDGVPLVRVEGGKTVLTEQCREALTEIFHRIDLDSNGVISRTEFDFFQERTSAEVCDDETWKVIQDNFEMTRDGTDELTLEGFLALHVMTAEDEEGGEEELWEVLSALGYSRQLQLDQACPFELEVFTEDCEGEIEIVDLLPFRPIVDSALSRLVIERGVCEAVRDSRGELHTYTFSTPHMTTIALENKGAKRVAVQLDCSRSTHCQTSRESSVHVMHVEPRSTVIGFHLMPENATEHWTVHCVASRILS